MPINNISFGHVRDIPQNAQETRIVPWIVSTFTRDRHHTILNQGNWKLENYRKNPIVGYMHTFGETLLTPPDPDFVIGKSILIDIEGSGNNRMLVSKVHFEPANVNLMAEKIFRKVLFGTLRSASVGFAEVGRGSWGPGDEAEGRVNETYRFAGQELLEWSVVNIPSNPDATKRKNRSVKEQGKSAILYALNELGSKYTIRQVEEMKISQVLDLLDGKDLGIRQTDPAKLHRMLHEPQAKLDLNRLIEMQQIQLRKAVLKTFKI